MIEQTHTVDMGSDVACSGVKCDQGGAVFDDDVEAHIAQRHSAPLNRIKAGFYYHRQLEQKAPDLAGAQEHAARFALWLATARWVKEGCSLPRSSEDGDSVDDGFLAIEAGDGFLAIEAGSAGDEKAPAQEAVQAGAAKGSRDATRGGRPWSRKGSLSRADQEALNELEQMLSFSAGSQGRSGDKQLIRKLRNELALRAARTSAQELRVMVTLCVILVVLLVVAVVHV